MFAWIVTGRLYMYRDMFRIETQTNPTQYVYADERYKFYIYICRFVKITYTHTHAYSHALTHAHIYIYIYDYIA